jgi:hypothetical protein
VTLTFKIARQKRAAGEVAKMIMIASLQQVPEEEREARIKAIQKVYVAEAFRPPAFLSESEIARNALLTSGKGTVI